MMVTQNEIVTLKLRGRRQAEDVLCPVREMDTVGIWRWQVGWWKQLHGSVGATLHTGRIKGGENAQSFLAVGL